MLIRGLLIGQGLVPKPQFVAEMLVTNHVVSLAVLYAHRSWSPEAGVVSEVKYTVFPSDVKVSPLVVACGICHAVVLLGS